MRFLSALLISTLSLVPSISASLMGTGNPAYYNPAPTFRLATTTAGSDALNTYTFMAINNIPADGSILLLVDKEYQQSNIVAGSDCIATATGFAPSDKSKGFSCTVNNGLLTLKGFTWIPGAQIVTFTVKGINNIRPSTVTHRAAQTQIRTIDGQGQLIDWSDMLTSLPFLSCTAAGADCSIGTGIPGVYSQLQACNRNNVQIQYCCPQGSHWTGSQYCSFDQVNLNIDPTKIYGTFSSHPGAPAPGNATFGPITPNSPFVVSTIQPSAYRYGGDMMMQYPSPATGAIIYPTFQFRYYREDGTLITSSNPTHMTQFDMQGYAAVPGGLDAEYGFLNFDDTNPWTAWLAQQSDFTVGTKVRYNVKIVAHADRTQTIPIPVAANSIDVWFMRI